MSHGWLYIAVNMLNHFFIIQFYFNKTSNKKHTVKKGMIYVPSYNTHPRREYIQVSCLLFDLVQFIHILKKIFVKLIIHTLLLMKYLLRKNNCTHLILIFRYTQFVVLVCFFYCIPEKRDIENEHWQYQIVQKSRIVWFSIYPNVPIFSYHIFLNQIYNM